MKARRLLPGPLLFAFLLSGCDREDPSFQQPKWEIDADTGKVPSTPYFEHKDFHFSAKAPRLCPQSGPMAPSNGKRRLSIPIEIKAASPQEVPVSPMEFTLHDEDGVEYRPTLAGCGPVVPRRTLTTPQQTKGEVAFDVPPGESKWFLSFHPFLVGRREVQAKVLVPLMSGDKKPIRSP